MTSYLDGFSLARPGGPKGVTPSVKIHGCCERKHAAVRQGRDDQSPVVALPEAWSTHRGGRRVKQGTNHEIRTITAPSRPRPGISNDDKVHREMARDQLCLEKERREWCWSVRYHGVGITSMSRNTVKENMPEDEPIKNQGSWGGRIKQL